MKNAAERSGALACLALLILAGCATHERVPFSNVGSPPMEVHSPKTDRCAHFKGTPETEAQCQAFKQTAVDYLHDLNVGDAICVDNGFGDEPGPGCKARAMIIDANNAGFMVEIRNPSLDSVWKNDNETRVWFENGALVDLYLHDKGYE